ncbi:hypothetical protein [Nitrosomonas sp. Nm166]|uniref:hypothetical protein n=1 Tax=Nitrosomonas sp. Nm166 TaxID=1881054 RepID=UPI0008F27DA7|nr:hypothetical protein [Nitrosomonas sp. Nm166]SFE34130.1 hypothetical protein SAMN05428977_101313 [Nitrosomonas sp. Nm166]
MLTLSTHNQIAIGLLMALLMILTRSHHFASVHSLADASWAIFFLAGIYLHSAWPLLGFFVLSWWLDFAAYTWGGVSDFCLTPAYVFLLPAYASLWLAGRWYSKRYQFAWRTVMPLSLSVIVGLTLCELFSSGGFYFFSGRITDTTLSEFGEQLVKYFPLYIETFVFYVGITVVIHALFVLIVKPINSRKTTIG